MDGTYTERDERHGAMGDVIYRYRLSACVCEFPFELGSQCFAKATNQPVEEPRVISTTFSERKLSNTTLY
jgi:hypothetical protein